jgi:RNA polymerase sigma-70 factor (ECF subfamily)
VSELPASQAEIVARLRRRDPAALREAYAQYHERIYRFLLRLAGRRALAEDLFQETWLAAARDAGDLAEGSDLGAWLFTVARNRWRSHRRWAMLDVTRLLSFKEEIDEEVPSPEGLVAARAEARAAQEAFARLSPAHREVLLLAVGEGMDAPRVAAVLGISADSARQRLHRARAELAKVVEEREDQPRKQGAA